MTTDQTPTQSPLAEADPNSLDLLFERINSKLCLGLPELITDDDLMPVVLALREARKKFLIEQDRLGKAPPAKRKAKVESVQQAIDLSKIDAVEF